MHRNMSGTRLVLETVQDSQAGMIRQPNIEQYGIRYVLNREASHLQRSWL